MNLSILRRVYSKPCSNHPFQHRCNNMVPTMVDIDVSAVGNISFMLRKRSELPEVKQDPVYLQWVRDVETTEFLESNHSDVKPESGTVSPGKTVIHRLHSWKAHHHIDSLCG